MAQCIFSSLSAIKTLSVSKKCVRRTTAVREVQYSDLFFRLHGVRHTLNYTQYTLSISYLDTQNWNVLLIFTLKRFVSVTKNMYPLKRKGKNYRLISFRIFISLFADTDINAEKNQNTFHWIPIQNIRICVYTSQNGEYNFRHTLKHRKG